MRATNNIAVILLIAFALSVAGLLLLHKASIYDQKTKVAKLQVTRLKQRQARLKKEVASLHQLFSGKKTTKPDRLVEKTPLWAQEIQSSADENDVSIQTMRIGSSQRGEENIPALVQSGPLPGLKEIKIHLAGRWSSLATFERWVADVRSRPITIENLGIGNKTFSVDLRIYGIGGKA